jgi:hypothetical protein
VSSHVDLCKDKEELILAASILLLPMSLHVSIRYAILVLSVTPCQGIFLLSLLSLLPLVTISLYVQYFTTEMVLIEVLFSSLCPGQLPLDQR